MKHLKLTAALLLAGCGTTLPEHAMRDWASMLTTTKAAWTMVCMSPLIQPPPPEIEAACVVSQEHINASIDLYTKLNEGLK